MLDRLKVMTLSMADGVPDQYESSFDRYYDFLRTQGVNADRTVPSFFFGERGTRIWKGEPFEQAYAYTLIGAFDATRSDWGNVRAAANNSLFLLRDFGSAAANPGRPDDTGLAEREVLLKNAAKSGRGGDLGVGYTPVASDYELGLMLKAIACRQLGEREELEETLSRLTAAAPRLSDMAGQIRGGAYNTVFIVEYGLGPQKMGAGPDNAIAVFRPLTRSDEAPLLVQAGSSSGQFPVATDFNRLARDVKWNNLEDLRRAKSLIGDVLLTGGLVVATAADDDEARWVGAAAAAAGLLLKATSAADTRHCEVLPQRTYIALASINGRGNPVSFEIAGMPETRLVLPDVPEPRPGRVRAHYVRLPMRQTDWAGGGVLYSNDATGEVSGPQLPYILGGRCVRTPTHELLDSYKRSGYLRDFTLQDLIDLYREEGIWVEHVPTQGGPGRHVLEGGRALFTPAPGSAGFARLYGKQAPPYTPRSRRVQELAASIAANGSETTAAR